MLYIRRHSGVVAFYAGFLCFHPQSKDMNWLIGNFSYAFVCGCEWPFCFGVYIHGLSVFALLLTFNLSSVYPTSRPVTWIGSSPPPHGPIEDKQWQINEWMHNTLYSLKACYCCLDTTGFLWLFPYFLEILTAVLCFCIVNRCCCVSNCNS